MPINEDKVNEQKPWPGLSAYNENDSINFFGRNKEIAELVDLIESELLVTIFGASGTGKTSLLKAGVSPKMIEKNILPIYIRLDHSKSAPDYIAQTIIIIKNKLAESKIETEELSKSILSNQTESLWEFFHRNEFWNKKNHLIKPLLIFDQLEEIFTLRKYDINAENFINEIGWLCENSVPTPLQGYLRENNIKINIPIHTQNYRVVVSLRDDFLAHLESITLKIPAFRKNRYGVNRFNGIQALDAVIFPGKKILNEEVALKIVYSVTNKKYAESEINLENAEVEPALLSLFCRELNEQRIKDNKNQISIEDVQESSLNILTNYYSECFSNISEKTREFVENKLLTDTGYRNAIPQEDIIQNGISVEDIDKLISLRLLRTEKRQGTRWIELSHDILTNIAISSRDKRRSDYELQNEKKRVEVLSKEKKIEIRKYRKKITLSLSFLVLLLISIIIVYFVYFKTYTEYYGSVVNKHGFITGLRQLEKDNISHRNFYYECIKQGVYGEYDNVYVKNGYGNLSPNQNIFRYIASQDDNEDALTNDIINENQIGVCHWELIKDKDGHIFCEKAYNKKNEIIYNFTNKNNINTSSINKSIFQYTDSLGIQNRKINQGLSYIRITYDNNGYDKLYEFFNSFGIKKANIYGDYAIIRKYDNNGKILIEKSLDQLGKTITNNIGVSIQYYSYQGDSLKITTYCNQYNEITKNKNGYAIKRTYYDIYGNPLKYFYYDEYNNPCLNTSINAHGIILRYNNNGNLEEKKYVGIDENSLVANKSDFTAVYKAKYDNKGRQLIFERLDKSKGNNLAGIVTKERIYDDISLTKELHYIFKDNALKYIYKHQIWKNNLNQDILSYTYNIHNLNSEYFQKKSYDKNNNLRYYAYFNNKMKPFEFNDINRKYHACYIFYKEKNNSIIKYYCDIANNLIPTGPAIEYFEYTNKSQKPVIIKSYDYTNKIINGYYYNYDEFGNIISKSYIGGVSETSFRGDHESKYYILNFVWNLQNNKIFEFVGYNEFNEPSLIEEKENVYYKKVISKDKYFFYDYNGEPIQIDSMKKNIKKYPVVYYIKLQSKYSPAYIAGVKDGDILFKYGDWIYNFKRDFNGLLHEEHKLNNFPKQISIVRFPECKIYRFNLPAGLTGFDCDTLHYTENEKIRLMSIINTIKVK